MNQLFPFQEQNCKHFSGYKPCFPGEDCSGMCQHPEPFGTRILIVNLDAMGDVLMTTAQLPAIKRAYTQSTIYWITLSNAARLLENNPFIDGVFEWNMEQILIAQQQTYDLVLNADKSKAACAFVETLHAKEIRGFRFNAFGQIIPANTEAQYNYQLGLDDQLKFRINKKTGQEILTETWRFPYERDEYTLILSEEEKKFCISKKQEWNISDAETVIGFNTGCSNLFPNKKMTIEQHVRLITSLTKIDGVRILLLGGKEDTQRNAEIYNQVNKSDSKVINTPTTEGIRRGLCYLHLADAVVTGDSFGMHASIGLRKHVFAWFGLSCWTEIDIYDRGKKYYQSDLFCSPCWKKICPYNLECISMIDLHQIEKDILHFIELKRKSS